MLAKVKRIVGGMRGGARVMRGLWKHGGSGIAAVLLGVSVGAKEKPVELRGTAPKITAPLSVAALNRLGVVALSGTPSKLGGFLPAFDRRLDTEYEPREAGAAQIVMGFSRLQSLASVRLLTAEGEYEWQLEAADNQPDLEAKGAPTGSSWLRSGG